MIPLLLHVLLSALACNDSCFASPLRLGLPRPARPPQGCMKYPQGVTPSGAAQSLVISSMNVGDAFQLANIGIENLSLTDPRIGALKVCGGRRTKRCPLPPLPSSPSPN